MWESLEVWVLGEVLNCCTLYIVYIEPKHGDIAIHCLLVMRTSLWEVQIHASVDQFKSSIQMYCWEYWSELYSYTGAKEYRGSQIIKCRNWFFVKYFGWCGVEVKAVHGLSSEGIKATLARDLCEKGNKCEDDWSCGCEDVSLTPNQSWQFAAILKEKDGESRCMGMASKSRRQVMMWEVGNPLKADSVDRWRQLAKMEAGRSATRARD